LAVGGTLSKNRGKQKNTSHQVAASKPCGGPAFPPMGNWGREVPPFFLYKRTQTRLPSQNKNMTRGTGAGQKRHQRGGGLLHFREPEKNSDQAFIKDAGGQDLETKKDLTRVRDGEASKCVELKNGMRNP